MDQRRCEADEDEFKEVRGSAVCSISHFSFLISYCELCPNG